MKITKSNFIRFRQCPVEFWFSKYRPKVLVDKVLSDFEQQIIDQGIEVENWARKLFSNGELVDCFGDDAVKSTQEKMNMGVTVIFQATFDAEGLFSMSDIIVWNPAQKAWDMYEVKGSTSKQKKKADHYWDLAFQKEVLEKSNKKVGQLYLVELNKEFEKQGEIRAEDLLAVTDITDEIDTMRIEIQTEIGTARKTLEKKKEPVTCACLYKSKAHQCRAFDYLYPNIPKYSIYQLSRIGNSKKKLSALVDRDIFDIKDIPNDNDLSPIQSNQVLVHNMDTEIFLKEEIQKEIEKIAYPIYFLDYETIPTAIQLYDHCHPYQQVPFQYSLHIKESPNSSVRHTEFLHQDKTNPIPELAQQLSKDIGDQGSIIVWNKSFEGKCNKDMAKQVPNLSSFLLDLNTRMYDLWDIFQKQMYVRKEFLGKTSIKNVLPVLVPEFSYSELAIQDGGHASSSYKQMIWGSKDHTKQAATVDDLLAYCKLDTLAMVEILDHIERRLMD